MSWDLNYRIVVQGRLAPEWSSRFEGLELRHSEGTTLLQGAVKDQAALYGHLLQLRDLGLEIISVSRCMEGDSGREEQGSTEEPEPAGRYQRRDTTGK